MIILLLSIFNISFCSECKIHESQLLSEYIYLSNNNLYNLRLRYIPCKSCGLGNKLLGLISSVAYGVSYSYSLKVVNWNSLWYYFSFPLKLDISHYIFNITYMGHFYGIKSVIENYHARNYLIRRKVIEYDKNINKMINNLAYRISSRFLIVSNAIKSSIQLKYQNRIDIGIHIRTGKADGKEYLLHYLKQNDVNYILHYIKKINNNNSIFISSDSSSLKRLYYNEINNIISINTSTCNSGYGLHRINDSCAIEAITDYYLLSKCNFLILTRCSSFSLISLFANRIGYSYKKKYKYFGNCSTHLDLYS